MHLEEVAIAQRTVAFDAYDHLFSVVEFYPIGRLGPVNLMKRYLLLLLLLAVVLTWIGCNCWHLNWVGD